ncbi:hypothetical protein ABW19_dt0207027 [Dactylella cylindrospora]|nr:hypothetical protein ABW19_dt0207027 [Dactylella cylindrospora]
MTPSPTHYTILSLPSNLPPNHPNYQTILKKAYHRTLLQCHPDKLPSAAAAGVAPPSIHHDLNSPPADEIYTIDQINSAYKTLSSPTLRQTYDATLQSPSIQAESYKTGLDVVDLDDMVYHEGAGESSGGRYTKSCRCGADEGYVLTEEEMDEVEDEISKHAASLKTARTSTARSMIVGCLGCSLWVQVDWVVCEDEDG